MEAIQSLRNKEHQTWLEVDLKAIEGNLQIFQSKIAETTKILAMVKASSYGIGDINIPLFLQEIGLDYLGVAYSDEGVLLRKNKVNIPILVLNTEKSALEDIIQYKLEPCIFSFSHLESLIEELKKRRIKNFPIHITIETGMNRLGFLPSACDSLLQKLKSSPEIIVKGVYSHLADADNPDFSYTLYQIEKFKTIKEQFQKSCSNSILFHILNSEGASKLGKQAGLNMVRLGIGMYGYTSTAKKDGLQPALTWKTTISQIKEIEKGETISYGRTFRAKKQMKIATLRVGYGDGFRRSLSNGKGSVYIKGTDCPVVGIVCMDMTLVDVTNVECQQEEEAEIIGENIDMFTFARRLQTIPYEVMTGIHKRVTRIYVR